MIDTTKNPLRIFLPLYKKTIDFFSRGYGIGRYHPVRKVLDDIDSLLKTNYVEVEGLKIFLDPNDSLHLSINGTYGEIDTNIFKNHIRKGNFVVDVGANIGYFSLIFAKLVNMEGQVFAFEPEPQNFELLKKNFSINNYQNIVCERKAVSDKNGNLRLYLSESSGKHSIFRNNAHKNSINVECIKLDDYFEEKKLIDKIDFVKIDVEGAELQVLKGMKSIISKNENLKIYTEYVPSFIEQSGSKPKEIFDLLSNEGFFFYKGNPRNQLESIDVSKLLSSNNNKNETINILCMRKS